jgi:outer membrane protein TolC
LPLALAACKVGPNYAGPPQDAALAHPACARAARRRPALARWWDTLGDARFPR